MSSKNWKDTVRKKYVFTGFCRSSYFFHLFHDTESAGVTSHSTQLNKETVRVMCKKNFFEEREKEKRKRTMTMINVNRISEIVYALQTPLVNM